MERDNKILQQPEKTAVPDTNILQQPTPEQDVPSTLQVSLPSSKAEHKAIPAPVKCSHILENGKQCGAFALSGEDLCFSHNPASRAAKLDAVTRGGQSNGLKAVHPLTPVEITKPQDVVTLLALTVNEVRSGQLAPKTASTLGFLCVQLLKAFEVTRETRQLDEIEKTFGIMPPKNYFG